MTAHLAQPSRCARRAEGPHYGAAIKMRGAPGERTVTTRGEGTAAARVRRPSTPQPSISPWPSTTPEPQHVVSSPHLQRATAVGPQQRRGVETTASVQHLGWRVGGGGEREREEHCSCGNTDREHLLLMKFRQGTLTPVEVQTGNTYSCGSTDREHLLVWTGGPPTPMCIVEAPTSI